MDDAQTSLPTEQLITELQSFGVRLVDPRPAPKAAAAARARPTTRR